MEAFSSRTRAVKEIIDSPGTPSSISSRETSNETCFNTRPSSNVHTPQKKASNLTNVPEITLNKKSLCNIFQSYFEACTFDPNGKFYLGNCDDCIV